VVAGDCVYWYENIEKMWPPAYVQGNTWNLIKVYRAIRDAVGDETDRIVPGHDPELFLRHPVFEVGHHPVAEIHLAANQESAHCLTRSVFATGGIVTAPHHLAADAGQDVLRDGGNAVEAMIAMAAAIPVVYPHMNAIGGDSFWIVKPAGRDPIGIDACGPVGGKCDR
jgi:hypothetical protein